MITYQLGINSSTAITLLPEWNYKERKKQIRSDHRTKAGKLYYYNWSNYKKFDVPVELVEASDASIVNSWFDSNTQLLFFVTSGSVTAVHSVMIVNDETPFQERMKPYPDKFKGTLLLESY